jgi:hypothetical protein
MDDNQRRKCALVLFQAWQHRLIVSSTVFLHMYYLHKKNLLLEKRRRIAAKALACKQLPRLKRYMQKETLENSPWYRCYVSVEILNPRRMSSNELDQMLKLTGFENKEAIEKIEKIIENEADCIYEEQAKANFFKCDSGFLGRVIAIY